MDFAGFDWDAGNRAKCAKHGVSIETIEGLFTRPLAILPDAVHSVVERRFKAFGKAPDGRSVFVVFTIRRGNLIRPISARTMHAREIRTYEKENPDLQKR
jgi:uncharacterized DUF497 family protein